MLWAKYDKMREGKKKERKNEGKSKKEEKEAPVLCSRMEIEYC
jgi:hypothetical protein